MNLFRTPNFVINTFIETERNALLIFLIDLQVLGLLWNLAHSEDVPTDIMDQALTAHIKILDYSCSQVRILILAQQIRISEILAWFNNTYLTHVTLPRLSHDIGCIGIHTHGCQVTSLLRQSNVIM